MSNTTYTAITIGPILKTFFEAKRTRAVWAASYFYSWISRRILEDSVNQEMQVFLPDISLMKVENNKKIGIKSKFGAGL
jgi:CRISPR-associated protein Cmr2